MFGVTQSFAKDVFEFGTVTLPEFGGQQNHQASVKTERAAAAHVDRTSPITFFARAKPAMAAMWSASAARTRRPAFVMRK